MKALALSLTVLLGLTQALPNGVYHNEYNYKTSSSSYKNNELQHKTDDEGYYSKDGDLEGRLKPRVESNSEHSEYVNPKLQNNFNTGFYGGANGDTSSYGHLRADNTYGGSAGYGASSSYSSQSQYGGQYQTDGVASSDHISGAFGSYGSNSQNSYGASSSSGNLRLLTSRLEQDLQRELQDAVYRNSYYTQNELENELRRNLTQRIQQALINQYGQQSIRGGNSYTISGGRVQSTPNYQQQELELLRNQLEDRLLQNLRSEYTRRSSSVQTNQHNVYDTNYVRQTTTTYRPHIYPNIPTGNQVGQYPVDVDTRPVYHPDSQPIYTTGGSSNYQSTNEESSRYHRVSNVRYTPVQNPQSITTIASNVQHQIDARLNRLLDDAQRQYFSENARYTTQNFDTILERLRNELKTNISYTLEDELRREYGNQAIRDGYTYSLGPQGQYSDLSNYRVNDLESLKRQVEHNLIEKLNRDFQTYRTRYQSQSKQAYVDHNTHVYSEYTTVRAIPFHHGVSTPLYDSEYYQPGRPTSPSIVPAIGAGIKGGHYVSGASHGGYEVSSGSSSAQLQRQLQADLSREIQAALNRQRLALAYTQTGQSRPSYETSYQRLYDELSRNLTRQFEEVQAGSSYSSYGNLGSELSQAQLDSMKAQLQNILSGQLQQGLSQTYSSSSSWSSSSSYGSGVGEGNRQVRGSDLSGGLGGYGQYRSGGVYAVQGQGEDCLGDDPNSYRAKRSYNSYGYRSQPLGLSTHAGTQSNYGGYSSSAALGRHQPLTSQTGQEEDNSDLTQQVETNDDLTQQIENEDLTQQVQTSDDLTQQIENQDLTQQIQNQDLTQQVENQDLTQQIENVGQTIEANEDLTQQIEDHQSLSHQSEYLTHQVQEEPIGKLQFGGQTQIDLGQQTEDEESNGTIEQHPNSFQTSLSNKPSEKYYDGQNQIDDEPIGNLEFGQQQSSKPGRHQESNQYIQQSIDNEESSDLTQQIETDDFQHPVKPNAQIQSVYDQDTVHTENVGNLNVGSQISANNLNQEQDNSNTQQKILENSDQGLTQQIETDNFQQLPSENQLNLDQKQTLDNIGKANDDLLIQQLDNISDHLNGNAQEPNSPFLDQTQQITPNNNYGANPSTNLNPTVKPNTDNTFISNAYLNLQTPTQSKLKQQLEENLRKQLQKSLHTEFEQGTIGRDSYQRLSVELCNNITKAIEKLLIKDYTFGANFDQLQRRKLQQDLEFDLKNELKTNLDAYSEQQSSSSGISITQQKQENEYTSQNNQQGNIQPFQPKYDTNNRYQHQRPWQRQHSFLEREREFHAYNHYKPYHSTNQEFPAQPLGSGSQTKPLIADNLYQQQEVLESQQGLTHQQTDLSHQQEGQTQVEEVNPPTQPQLPATPDVNSQTSPQYPQYHHGYTHNHRPWNAVPPRYVPYAERTRLQVPPSPYRPQFSSVPEPIASPPQIPYQIRDHGYVPMVYRPRPAFHANLVPPNQIDTQTNLQIPTAEPGYVPSISEPKSVVQEAPLVPNIDGQHSIESVTHTQIGEPGYVPSISEPKPVFQEATLTPNIDGQHSIQSISQTQIGEPGNVPSNNEPKPKVSFIPNEPTGSVPEQTNLGGQQSFQSIPSSNVDTQTVPATSQNTFGVASNSNLYTQQQSINEAQQQSNYLIEQIRQMQRRRYQEINGGQGQASVDVAVDTAQKPGTGSLVSSSASYPTDQQLELGQETIDDDQTSESGGQNQLIGGGLELDVQNKNKLEQQVKNDLTKQLLIAIEDLHAKVFANERPNKKGYQYIYETIHTEIQSNVTKLLTEACEPGQGKYSELIPQNLGNKQEYVKNLQNQLEIELCKILDKEIEKKQTTQSTYGNSYQNQYTRYQHRHQYQYGTQGYFNQNTEIASNLHPQVPPQPQQASEVYPQPPKYNQNFGVKGHRSSSAYHPQNPKTYEIEEKPFVQENEGVSTNLEAGGVNPNVEQVEILSTTPQPLSWWQKMKKGASKLKEKIVGPSKTE